MWTGIGIGCEALVACWIINYLFNKFDTNGEIKTALHKLIVSRLTKWTNNETKSGS